MNISHTIRVLLNDGRCQKHYIISDEVTVFEDFMFYDGDPSEWTGWKINGSFYNKDMVTGFLVEKFKGIIVNANGYEVLCEDPSDLFLTVQTQMDARIKEANALRAYLEGLMKKGEVDITRKVNTVSDGKRTIETEIVDNGVDATLEVEFGKDILPMYPED